MASISVQMMKYDEIVTVINDNYINSIYNNSMKPVKVLLNFICNSRIKKWRPYTLCVAHLHDFSKCIRDINVKSFISFVLTQFTFVNACDIMKTLKIKSARAIIMFAKLPRVKKKKSMCIKDIFIHIYFDIYSLVH